MHIQPEASSQAIIEELGKRLARQRLNQNLTQEQLATEAGMGINTVYRVEQGHSTQLSNLIRILRALGLMSNLDWLVSEPPPSPLELVRLKKKERRRASPQKVKKPDSLWKWNDQS